MCARPCTVSYLSNNENMYKNYIEENIRIVQCYIPLKLFFTAISPNTNITTSRMIIAGS